LERFFRQTNDIILTCSQLFSFVRRNKDCFGKRNYGVHGRFYGSAVTYTNKD